MVNSKSLTPNLGGKREGAGRKKVLDETKSVTFECELQLLSLIDKEAKDKNASRAEIIRSILKNNLPLQHN